MQIFFNFENFSDVEIRTFVQKQDSSDFSLTPGLHAKSTSIGCNFGPNGQKSKNNLKNAMKTWKNYRIVKISIKSKLNPFIKTNWRRRLWSAHAHADKNLKFFSLPSERV